MKEIEVLVDFDNNEEEMSEKLSKFEFVKELDLYDTYYEDPLRDNLKPEDDLRINEIFRVRRIGNDCLITYKKNHFDGKRWLYSDEYETKAENYETIETIIKMLGLEEQIVVNNKRRYYKTDEYEITLDHVVGYGCFLEVEKMTDDDVDVKKIKDEIRSFIKELNLKNVKELNIGKNQLMLAKKLGRNINLYVK